jgi:hypothetical protein
VGVNIYECMEERLDLVIRKIILPHYPSIVRYSVTSEGARQMRYNFVFDRPIYKDVTTFVVEYFFDTYKNIEWYGDNVVDETFNLFELLGPNDGDEVTVHPKLFMK